MSTINLVIAVLMLLSAIIGFVVVLIELMIIITKQR